MAYDQGIAVLNSFVYRGKGLIIKGLLVQIAFLQPKEVHPNDEHKGACWASMGFLANRLNCHRSSIKHCMARLLEDGWITKETYLKKKVKHNRYWVVPDLLERLEALDNAITEPNPNKVRAAVPHSKNGQFTSEPISEVIEVDEPAPVIQPKPVQTPVPAPARQPYVAPAPRKGFGDYISECREAIVSLMEKNPPAGEFSWTDFTTGNRLYSQFDKEGDAVERAKEVRPTSQSPQ